MSQLYARVFVQILDSSIAEDFTTRHVFEDFFKLCDRTGVVDMTRQAISRRLNCPIEMLNQSIERLEAEDPSSRDQAHGGRRIERLDAHRDWGWRILNWEKYDAIRTRADCGDRVAKQRESASVFDPMAALLKITDQPEVVTAWESWILHRKQKRAPLTDETCKRQLVNLETWGAGNFIAAIDLAIASGWTGMFERKEGSNGATQRPPPIHIQLKTLDEEIATHPANHENPRSRNPTQAQIDDLHALKKKRKELVSKTARA